MANLLLIVFINFVGIGALIPILPFTVIDGLGHSEIVMTALLASFAFAMFVANPLLGRLSDLLGRRPVLLLSLFVGTVAHLWFALTNDIMQMFAARIVAGLAAGNIGVIQAIIADRTSPEDRAKTMGLLGAAIGSGFVLGPALGGVLGGIGSGPVHQVPFLIAGLFSALSFGLAFRLAETSQTSASPSPLQRASFSAYLSTLFSGHIGGYAAAFFCLNLAFAQVEASYVLLVRDLLGFGARQTGWLFTYIGVLIIIVQGGLISRVVGQLGEMKTIASGVALLAVGQFVTVALAYQFLSGVPIGLGLVLLSTTLVCVGFAFTNPTLTSSASKVANTEDMGGSLGFVQGCGSIGQVLGLVSAGPFYSFGGGVASFGFGGCITVMLLLIIWAISRQQTSA